MSMGLVLEVVYTIGVSSFLYEIYREIIIIIIIIIIIMAFKRTLFNVNANVLCQIVHFQLQVFHNHQNVY